MRKEAPQDKREYGALIFYLFFQAEDGIRDYKVTGVQTCALPIYFFISDAATHIHLHVVDGRNGVGDSLDVHLLLRFRLVGDARLPRDHHPDVIQQPRLGFHELVFHRLDLRVALLHGEKLFGVEISEKGHSHHAEAVRTHGRDFLGDIHVHAVNQRRDRNQRGGGQDDAQQREETTQLVLAQRINGDASRLPKRSAQTE